MFFRKKPPKDPDLPDLDTSQPALSKYAGDWTPFRPEIWAPMKVWLPDAVDERLRQLSAYTYESRSALIRNALFIYVYGDYVFGQMRVEADGLFYVKRSDSDMRFSRRMTRTPQLGKNHINYKVQVPPVLREELQKLADHAGLVLSHFVREILISHFLGHRELPERIHLIGEARSYADDWPPDEPEAPEPEEK